MKSQPRMKYGKIINDDIKLTKETFSMNLFVTELEYGSRRLV